MVAALSYVVVTDRFKTIRRLMECLLAQTARSEVELVIVGPIGARAELAEGVPDEFAAVRIVEEKSIWPMGAARAAGVRAATAPIVFLGETHSYAHPAFAATLIAAHDGPWDVIVPGLENGNPDSALSWASFLPDYGTWHRALPPGELGSGPTWNVAYKREALLALGDNLEHALSSGDELWSAFRAQGRKWYHAPDAPLEHVNVSRPRAWAHERYLAGVMVAANRNLRWSLPRRMAYVLASPLIAVALLSRLRTPLRAVRSRQLPAGTIPALVAGVFIRTLGEAVGYIRGASREDESQMEDYELHKLKHTIHAE